MGFEPSASQALDLQQAGKQHINSHEDRNSKEEDEGDSGLVRTNGFRNLPSFLNVNKQDFNTPSLVEESSPK